MALLDDRRYPRRPIIGVGALILKRDRILMAQRGKQPLKGWWSLPGGALEVGESLDCAVPLSEIYAKVAFSPDDPLASIRPAS